MFPNVGAHLVSVLVISVDASGCEEVASEARALMESKSALPGFIEGEVFTSEDRERVLVITEWTSRHEWSASQWDRQVSSNVVSIVESATAVDSRTYFRGGRITPIASADGSGPTPAPERP